MRPLRNPVIAFVAAGVVCALCLIWTIPLREADWHVPFYAEGDFLVCNLLTKTLIEQPWYMTNARLGAPWQLNWFDFPMSDALHITLLKLVTLGTGSYGLAINVFFVLGFFMTTYTALVVLRQLGLSFPSSIAGAILFAFTPYHFYRNESHLFLSCYYIVPLTVLVVMRISSRERMLSMRTSVIICVLTASSGVYYAFFAVLLLLGVGLQQIAALRSWRNAKVGFCLAGVIAVTVLVNVSPALIYSAEHGRNSTVASRNPVEAETYGLKILQLILPIRNHRLALMRFIRTGWGTLGEPPESEFSSMGVVASIGLLILLCGALVGFPSRGPDRRLERLSFLTVVAVLIGVSGGLGPVFAYFLSPQIRAYNRISIYIVFFCLAAFLIAFEAIIHLAVARFRPATRFAVLTGIAGTVLVAGILDQTAAIRPALVKDSQAYLRRIEEFVQQVEKGMPERAMILQLPYMPFPESPPVNGMYDYEPLYGYLGSRTLRWSYGVPRGRYADSWMKDICSRSGEDLTEYAVLAGYQGIYIDRFGYKNANEIEGPIRATLNQLPLHSADGRFVFYDLRTYANRLHSTLPGVDWQQARQAVRSAISYRLMGCSITEGGGGLSWHWCGGKASIIVENPTTQQHLIEITAQIAGSSAAPAHVTVNAPGLQDQYLASTSAEARVQELVRANPGRTIIRLSSDGKPLLAPGDPRSLVMKVENLRLTVPDEQKLDTSWTNGCYPVESNGANTWHWCSSSGDLRFRNSSSSTLTVPFSLTFATAHNDPSTIRIDGPGFTERQTVTSAGSSYRHSITVPPGESRVRFSSDAKRADAPLDPRMLVFRIIDFHLHNPALEPRVIGDGS